MFGRATITLGIGPHSSLLVSTLFYLYICGLLVVNFDLHGLVSIAAESLNGQQTILLCFDFFLLI